MHERNSDDDNEKVGRESGGKKFLIFSKMSHFHFELPTPPTSQCNSLGLGRNEARMERAESGGKKEPSSTLKRNGEAERRSGELAELPKRNS